jgi:LCP family protein required for cell wall assembly
MRLRTKVIIWIVGAVVCLIAAIGISAAVFISQINNAIHTSSLGAFDLESLNKVLVKPERTDEPFYVLIVGSDTRVSGTSGNSDSLMLCRIDPSKPQVTILSIPRDTEVQIEGHGTKKINAAYAYDGAAGAVAVVSKLCDVDIAHYVEVDFNGVVSLVDRLGGVSVKVPVTVDFEGIHLDPGTQTLDGRQALVFSRCRNYPMGDFQRVVNQRLLMQAVAKRVLSASIIDMPGLVSSLAECVGTDLEATEAIDLLLRLQGMSADSMYLDTVPSYPNYHDEVSYVAIDVPAFDAMMARVDAGLPPTEKDGENVALNNVVQ